MRKPTCEMCDRGNCVLSARGWCDTCEKEFAEVMERINCMSDVGGCTSPITCRMTKRCVQLRAAVTLINGKGL